MQETLIKAGQLILSLSILIIIHELGHFMAARFFKTRVEKFYLFFNPWFSLWKSKIGETEYGLGWLPLGGYVKISGMIDESMDKEQMKLPPQPWEFRAKPAWQRLIIMLGGITMNILLGIFIYAMILFFSGEEYLPNSALKNGIACDSTALHMGLQNGDKIISIDGKPVVNFNDIPLAVIINQAKSITVNRNGGEKTISIPSSVIKELIDSRQGFFISPRVPAVIGGVMDSMPAQKMHLQAGDKILSMAGIPLHFFDEMKPVLESNVNQNIPMRILRGKDTLQFSFVVPKTAFLGIFNDDPLKYYPTSKTEYGFFASFPAGVYKAWSTLKNYVKQFQLIFSPQIQGYKHLGGFISIGKAFSPTWDWFSFWNFTAFLSIVLAFMNLLPIPALDGGHVLFTLIEMVTKRKPSEKFLEYAQMTGMALLLLLLLYANGNDIVKLFHK